jgi:hypothetical protein
MRAATLALVIAASALLYRFVEAPARGAPRAARRGVAAGAFAALAAVLAAGPIHGALFSAGEMRIFGAWTDREAYRCGKIARLLDPAAISCEIAAPAATPAGTILFVGNSHADSIKRVVADAAAARGVSARFMVENNPLMAGGSDVAGILGEAKRRKAGAIVLHYSPGALPVATLDALRNAAAAAGVRVAFLMPVPVWPQNVPLALWRGAPPRQDIADYRAANGEFQRQVEALGQANLAVYDVAPAFCTPDCALAAADGTPFYFDDAHLTLTGARALRALVDRVIGDLM